MIFLHLFFLCARPFDQQLGSSMIYFFYLHTTIPQKYMIVFHLFFPCAQTFNHQLGSSLFFFYLCTAIRPKLKVTLIRFSIVPIFRLLYSRSYFPYISLALFLAVLPLYFVGYIHSSTTIIFCTLYSRRSVAVIFCTLYPWLCEVLVKQLTRKASRELSQKCLVWNASTLQNFARRHFSYVNEVSIVSS